MSIPPRKRLPHEIPFGIDPAQENYFITICCEPRGLNHLAYPTLAKTLFATIQYRNDRGVWFAYLTLLMPDHVHLILSFPECGKRMQTVMSKWKDGQIGPYQMATRFFSN